MEVAPLRGIGSHSKAARAYVVGEMADVVWEEIKRKSEGYGSNPRSIIHLLMYQTDWRFLIGSEVTNTASTLLGHAPDEADRPHRRGSSHFVAAHQLELSARSGLSDFRSQETIRK